MDTLTQLIMIKNKHTGVFEDKTSEVSAIKYTSNKASVTYESNGATYDYLSNNVRVFSPPKLIDLSHTILCINKFPLSDCEKALDFGEYVKLIYSNQNVVTYLKSEITFERSCLEDKKPREVFEYLKALSGYVSIMDDGRTVLRDQFEKIAKISEESVLATYLSGTSIKQRESFDMPIFPFGFNLSQKEAVRVALENSISVIEGPPGTGKTQTILNIIANIVAKEKKVAVVSGNNSAIANAQEKLEKYGYGFITALLGSSKNKDAFFEHKQSTVPEMKDWSQDAETIEGLKVLCSKIITDLTKLLEDRNNLAKFQEELSKLQIEQTYYESQFRCVFIPTSSYSWVNKWASGSIVSFLNHFERYIVAEEFDHFFPKVHMFFKYGIYKFQFIKQNQAEIIPSLKKSYYESAIGDREIAINNINDRLKNKNYEELMQQYIDISKSILKATVHSSFSTRNRGKYSAKSFKHKFEQFIKDYPVILSTTHSIRNCISENYMFDYLIIDEASQVDLITATLALTCCRNVVIVGDVNQLPQIVTTDVERLSSELFYKNDLNEAYNYSRCSIISSLIKLFKDGLPKTLLCEHYRCHPKIIGFCNEKFYNNKLIIMTEEKPEDIPLRLYKTAPGNHARKDKSSAQNGWFNIRQIEVVRDEIIGANRTKYGDLNDVGIISPYRNHAEETKKYFPNTSLEVDTVHKFQGREKDTIIFTTVLNKINSFVDEPNLINVAVSRAVKELIIVTSNTLFKQHGTNIGDLIRYIEYNSLEEAIVESQKISVFDLLYSEYSDKLLKYRNSKKEISKYQSENLMYSVIEEVLEMPEFNSFKCVIHVPLGSIVRDFSALDDRERAFAENPWTHVDFLIFNKLDKEPVLVVEVDGFEYHRNSEKQRERDQVKDKILGDIGMPILRIGTNESGEKERLMSALGKVVEESGMLDNVIENEMI